MTAIVLPVLSTTLKVLTHQAIGEVTPINNVKMQVLLPVPTWREANTCIKFAKRIKFCTLFCAEGQTMESTPSSSDDALVMVEL